MSNEQQDREEEIFLKALEMAPGEKRSAWLEEACGGEPDLRRDIEELLEAHHEPAPLFRDTWAGCGSSNTWETSGEQPGERFGRRYELIEEIGRGGMGTVWLAEQSEPVKRKVALKIIKLGMDTREVVARFEAERQALARMDHPGIAKVFDAGVTDNGRPFFVMELVEGQPLTRYCDEQRLGTRERLSLFIEVCRAVQHAHQKGVIHRDLKPSNILVTGQDGRPAAKVIDFGVAKAVEEKLTQQTLMTGFGRVIGTLEYMSPEQAGGEKDIDTRSDIYSLGVILYELLSGTLPFSSDRFREAAFDAVLKMIREEDPLKPSSHLSQLGETASKVAAQRSTEIRKLARTISGDLDWIVMRALERDRSRRYETANAFAKDLLRYLANEPVEARPISSAEQARRWCKKHPTWIASLVALILLLVGITVVSLMSAHRVRQANQKTQDLLFNMRSEEVERIFEKGNAREGLARLAQMARERPDDGRLRRRLASALQYGSFPVPGVSRIWHEKRKMVAKATLPGRAEVLTLAQDGKIRHWDMAKGTLKELIFDLGEPVEMGEISANGALIAIGRPDNSILLIDENGRRISAPLRHKKHLTFMAIGPHGRRLVSCEERHILSVWDCATGERLAGPISYNSYVAGVAFRDDGSEFAVSVHDVGVSLWDPSTGVQKHLISDVTGYISLTYSPDGTQLAGGAPGGPISVWDLKSSRRIHEGLGHPLPNRVNGVRFSPDGRFLLSYSSDQSARLWSLETGRLVHIFPHHSFVSDGKFSNDGRFIVTACHDSRARIWDANTGERICEPMVHGSGLNWVDFDESGSKLFVFCHDGTAWIWDIRPAPFAPVSIKADQSLQCAAYSSDGNYLATGSLNPASSGNAVRIWNSANGRKEKSFPCDYLVGDLVFSPRENQLAASFGRETCVWDLDSGDSGFREENYDGGKRALTFSPDGRWLLVREKSTISLVDVAGEQLVGKPMRHSNSEEIASAAFSPDGRLILSVATNGEAIVRERADQKIIGRYPFDQNSTGIGGMFHPNGRWVITFFSDHFRGWDPLTGVATWGSRVEAEIAAAKISRDGRRLVTAGKDGTFSLWSCQSGPDMQLEHTIKHGWKAPSIALSPDGRFVAAGSADHSARIWDVATGLPITGRLMHRAEVAVVEFSPDGSQLMTASLDGEVKLWPLPRHSDGEDAVLPDLAEFVAGGSIDARGQFRVFSNDEALIQEKRLAFTGDRSGQGDQFLLDWYLGLGKK